MGARGSRLAAAQALRKHVAAAHTFLALPLETGARVP